MSTKKRSTGWVRVAKNPFAEENVEGYRIARIDCGTGTVVGEHGDRSVIIAVRDDEETGPELSIVCGPTTDAETLGMNLSKEVTFHGDVAVAVAALLALGAGRLSTLTGGPGSMGGFAVIVED